MRRYGYEKEKSKAGFHFWEADRNVDNTFTQSWKLNISSCSSWFFRWIHHIWHHVTENELLFCIFFLRWWIFDHQSKGSIMLLSHKTSPFLLTIPRYECVNFLWTVIISLSRPSNLWNNFSNYGILLIIAET